MFTRAPQPLSVKKKEKKKSYRTTTTSITRQTRESSSSDRGVCRGGGGEREILGNKVKGFEPVAVKGVEAFKMGRAPR